MTTEVGGLRSDQEVGRRNQLQRELLQLCLDENLVRRDDLAALTELFRKVSDIIDGADQEYETIRTAFNSGDFNGAARMIKVLLYN